MKIPEGATYEHINGLFYKKSNKYWLVASGHARIWTKSGLSPSNILRNSNVLPKNKTLCAPAMPQKGFLSGGQADKENIYPFMVIGIGRADGWGVQHPNGHVKREKSLWEAHETASRLKDLWDNNKYNAILFKPNPNKPKIIFPPHTVLERAVIGYNSVMKQPITIQCAEHLLECIKFAEKTHVK